MFKNNEKTLNTPAAYVQPVCKSVTLSVESSVLTESQGDGKPDGPFTPIEGEDF